MLPAPCAIEAGTNKALLHVGSPHSCWCQLIVMRHFLINIQVYLKCPGFAEGCRERPEEYHRTSRDCQCPSSRFREVRAPSIPRFVRSAWEEHPIETGRREVADPAESHLPNTLGIWSRSWQYSAVLISTVPVLRLFLHWHPRLCQISHILG